MEAGFSDFGPTLAINGTLRARNSDQLISNMKIELIRCRDKATYTFNWNVFRNLDHLQLQNSKLDVASAFSVRIADPRKMDIQYNDVDTRDRMVGPVLNMRSKFQNYINSNHIKIPEQLDEGREIFRASEKALILEVYNKLNKQFYWEAGEYDLVLHIKTDQRNKSFCRKFKFSLSENDVQNLGLNVVGIMEQALFKETTPNFSYVKYTAIS